MMKEKHTDRVIQGAIVLTIAGIISKVLSASYRVPLQNLTGDMGFYMYQQVYPVIGIALMMGLYGFPAAVSIVRAHMDIRKLPVNIRTFFLPLGLVIFVLSSLFFIPLFLYGNDFARFIGDERLGGVYQTASILFLLLPLTSIFRGYFQGNNLMQPTAYSQIGEQVVRVSIIVLGAYACYIGVIEIESIGYVAVISAICGVLTAAGIGWIYIRKESFPVRSSSPIQWGFYIRTMVAFGLVASLNHMLLLMLQLVDTITLIPQLQMFGLDAEEAMRLKGVFDRGQPLIQFGTVLGSSFALALLPAMSTARWKKKTSTMHAKISNAFACSVYIATGATVGLFILFPEVNLLLFTDTQGTGSLRVLVLAIILSSMAITLIAMLQGAGKVKETAFAIGCICFAKVLFNAWFVPMWGITGSALATVSSLFLLCLYLLWKMHSTYASGVVMRWDKWRGMLQAATVMAIYLYVLQFLFAYWPAPGRIVLFIYMVFSVSTGAFIYVWGCIRWNLFTKEMIEIFPGARWIKKIYRL